MFPVITNQYGNPDIYQVANDVNDIVDTDHNTVVDSEILLGARSTVNFGGGEFGNFVLGLLTAPSTGGPAQLQASANGSGLLTGSFRYRSTFFNASGETPGTSDPGVDVSLSNNAALVQNLPLSGQPTLITGRRVYRSADAGSTWKMIAEIYDNTTTTFTDNNPLTSGASIPVSNTTGNSVTYPAGVYNVGDATIGSGQTVTVGNTGSLAGILILLCKGNASISGTVTGTGVFRRTASPHGNYFPIPAGSNQPLGSNGSPFSGNTAQGQPGFSFGTNYMDAFNMQGAGEVGLSSGTVGFAGGTFGIIASGSVTVSGTINCNGGNGNAVNSGAGGGAGGYILLKSLLRLNLTGTLNVNGGNGANAINTGGGFNSYGGGAGGGGFIVLSAPNVIDTSTKTVAGGTSGSSSTNSSQHCPGGGGGSNSGAGTAGGPGGTGTAGQVITSNDILIPLRGLI